jgi:hypothetical protein
MKNDLPTTGPLHSYHTYRVFDSERSSLSYFNESDIVSFCGASVDRNIPNIVRSNRPDVVSDFIGNIISVFYMIHHSYAHKQMVIHEALNEMREDDYSFATPCFIMDAPLYLILLRLNDIVPRILNANGIARIVKQERITFDDTFDDDDGEPVKDPDMDLIEKGHIVRRRKLT